MRDFKQIIQIHPGHVEVEWPCSLDALVINQPLTLLGLKPIGAEFGRNGGCPTVHSASARRLAQALTHATQNLLAGDLTLRLKRKASLITL